MKNKNMKLQEKLEENKKLRREKLEENERKNPFILAGFGIACIVSGYYLAYNLNFFVLVSISKLLICVLLFSGITCLISTVNIYFRNKRNLLFIAFGVLLIPCNYMWYLLWPNVFTKIFASLAFFMSIMFSTAGFLSIIYDGIINLKKTEKKNYTSIVLGIVGQIISILLAIIQFISALK